MTDRCPKCGSEFISFHGHAYGQPCPRLVRSNHLCVGCAMCGHVWAVAT